MHFHQNRPRTQIGASPGTLVRHDFADDSRVRWIEYDRTHHSDLHLDSEQEVTTQLVRHTPGKLRPRRVAAGSPSQIAESQGATSPSEIPSAKVTWINVDGLANIELLKQLGNQFGLHALALEDVVNVNQHAKLDSFDNNSYLVLRMPTSHQPFVTEQVSLFLIGDTLITFQEYPGDCLNPVRERLATGKGRIRARGADYLAYAVIDAVIDGYFPVLDHYEALLQEISNEIEENSGSDIPMRLHHIRADLLNIRKVAVQHRDAAIGLTREDTSVITDETQLHLRDCQDHISRLIESADTYRETCGELRELYFAQLGQRTNDVMKVLTIIATIFIPMSFIAGVYGMNFDTAVSPFNMPELHWAFGYPFAIAVMLATGGGLVFYLRRKGWL
ncbi:MAG: magnesium/cobalt transporter CorA [Pirellulaceae bacterium]